MMKSNMKTLVNQYHELEDKILQELEKLNYLGSECSCKKCCVISLVYYGFWKEISSYCINCGGVVMDDVWKER